MTSQDQKKPEDDNDALGETEPDAIAQDTSAAPEFMSGLFDPGESDKLKAEVAELKDQLLRALAESENIRRRAERERQDTSRYAIANFAKAILSVADNMQRALASVSDEQRDGDPALKNLCVGLDYTMAELMNAYKQFGIAPIEAKGKRFDANFHQAMFELEDASVAAGTVVQEMQRGYMIHDRLLRPAMVGVSKGGPKEAAADGAPGEAPPAPQTAASQAYERQAEATEQQAGAGEPKLDTQS